MTQSKVLNIGGGEKKRGANYDVLDFPTEHYKHNPALIDYLIDLNKCKKWGIKSDSYDYVFSSHTLEHLDLKATEFTLKESYRVLKKGGWIRLVLPDFDLAWEKFKGKDKQWFNRVYGGKINNAFADRVFCKFFGGKINTGLSSDFLHFFAGHHIARHRHNGLHREWFNFDKIKKLLQKAGFTSITKKGFNESVHKPLLLDFAHKEMSFCVEAKKLCVAPINRRKK